MEHPLRRVPLLLCWTVLPGLMTVAASEVVAEDLSCDEFRNGIVMSSEIAVFQDLADMSDGEPGELRTITYLEVYVKQPHLRGLFGQYPPPDWEFEIGFQINVDTGQPTPQDNPDYARSHRENRDFIVSVSSTWVTVSEHFPPAVALPVDGSITVKDYEVAGRKYGMLEVSFLPAIALKGAGDYARERNENLNVFIDLDGNDLRTYMTCQAVKGHLNVPSCHHVQIIDGFLAKTRFKRSLIGDYERIANLSEKFVKCLFLDL